MRISESEAQELRAFASSQESKKQFAAAAVVFHGLHSARGGHPDDLFRAAVNLEMSGQCELADELFSVLLDKYGRAYNHCLRAGLCKLRLKHYDLAFTLFDDAYTQMSTAEAANYCAVSLRLAGKHRSAIRYYQAALAIDPRLEEARIELGSCYEALEEWGEAVEAYRGAVGGDNANIAMHVVNRMGHCLERAGDFDGLRSLLETADYYNHLDSDYAVINTVRWLLKVGTRADAELLAPMSRACARKNSRVIDALSLYILSWRPDQRHALYKDYCDLLASDEHGQDALRIVNDYPIDKLEDLLRNCKFDSTAEGLDRLHGYLESGNPMCLMRLGDGEGNFLADHLVADSVFLDAQRRKILEIWFGDAGKHAHPYRRLRHDLQEAIAGADLLGVPSMGRIRDESINDVRGYWGVYFAACYAATTIDNTRFVSPNIHLDLFRSRRTLAALGAAKAVHTISCHWKFGGFIRRLTGVGSGVDLVVPGEVGNPNLPDDRKHGNHFPHAYDRVLEAISGFSSGSVVLVSAGVCGKVYAYHAKKAGCLGLDVGAMADYFMGLKTRKIFNSDRFNSAHKHMFEPDIA
jgi:tetratricopeptide (TPR) repeat protein